MKVLNFLFTILIIILLVGCSDKEIVYNKPAERIQVEADQEPKDWCNMLDGRLNKKYIEELQRYEEGCQFSEVDGEFIKYNFLTETGDIALVETFFEKSGQIVGRYVIGMHNKGQKCEVEVQYEPYKEIKDTCKDIQ